MDLFSPDYHSECEFDVPLHIIEYDPQEMPFLQEDCIDTLFPKIDKYKEKLAEFPEKEPGSIKILKKEKDRGNKEHEKIIKDMVNK